MNKFTFSYPTKVYFGERSAMQALQAELGKVGENVMLAYGGGSIKRTEFTMRCELCLPRRAKKGGGLLWNYVKSNLYKGAGRCCAG